MQFAADTQNLHNRKLETRCGLQRRNVFRDIFIVGLEDIDPFCISASGFLWEFSRHTWHHLNTNYPSAAADHVHLFVATV